MSTDNIQVELSDRILTLRFNRPDKKNAITQAMYSALAEKINEAAGNSEVRVLMFSGQPDCFTSGNDMKDFMAAAASTDMDNPTIRFMKALSVFPKPVVAAASGMAIGVGVTMLLHCDLVYCGEQTRLSMPFVNIGICPEFVSSYLLPRIMGHVRAAELLLLGEPFTAQTAREYGLVNAVAPNAGVEALARQKALAMAQLPPNTMRTCKALLKRWHAETTREAIPLEMMEVAKLLTLPEAHESIGAFMQKRKPDFSKFA